MKMRWSVGLRAPMLATVPFAPILATIATVLFYITLYENARALILGFTAALVAWLVLAIFIRPYLAVDRANRSVYRELRTRVDMLEVQLNRYRPREAGSSMKNEDAYRPPDLEDIEMLIQNLRGELRESGDSHGK